MSTLDEKLERVEAREGAARRVLYPRCPGRSRYFGGSRTKPCAGLECDWNYTVIESDKIGPRLVSIRPMDETLVWARKEWDGENKRFIFALVGRQEELDLGLSE